MIDETICEVDAPHFCAGLIFLGSLCVDAAPILKWCKGKQRPYLERYFKQRGWQFTCLEDSVEGDDAEPKKDDNGSVAAGTG